MTGHQRLEASRDDFISALSLGDSTGIKIHLEEPLALTLLDEYYEPGIPHMHGRVSGLLPIPSVVNRIMRSSFFPRSGNNDEIHGRAWNVIKYIMDGTRFDVMDLIIREIATSKGDKTKSIYFAPYIMKLILSKIDFTEVCDVEHKEYQPRVAPPQAPPPPPPAPFQPSEQITDTQSHPGQQASQAEDPALAAILRLQTSIDARFDRMDARNEQMHAETSARLDSLDLRVNHMDEYLTMYQHQISPYTYHRYGTRPSRAGQQDVPPSSSDATPSTTRDAPPS